MNTLVMGVVLTAAILCPAARAAGQESEFVVRQGGQVIAREKATRSADRLSAELAGMGARVTYDPLPTARRLRLPVLVLHGATDRQVPAEQAEELAAAIRAGGNRDVTVRILPALNHLFLHDPVGTAEVAEYAALPSKKVPREFLNSLAEWVTSRLR